MGLRTSPEGAGPDDDDDGFEQPGPLFDLSPPLPRETRAIPPAFVYPSPTAGRHEAGWMVSFADLISLLLTFFVLMFSMSELPADRWRSLTDVGPGRLNPAGEGIAAPRPAEFNLGWSFRRQAMDLDYLARVLEKTIADDPRLGDVRLRQAGNQLVVSLPADFLFQDGGATMTATAREAVRRIGFLLRNLSNKIGVMGYTEPTLASGGNFSSSWEMAIARAGDVANALHQDGYESNIVAYGNGDGSPQRGETRAGAERSALARGVDILILPAATGS
ncbi:MAG: flagellar motor protein MotB [Alphaproteobacteria bacterium]